MNIDEGILTSKEQLPVTQLNYGGSADRFSWILYRLDYLRCSGKAVGAEYPSEHTQNEIHEIEAKIQENTNDISSLASRTTKLEENVINVDYYFRYQKYV